MPMVCRRQWTGKILPVFLSLLLIGACASAPRRDLPEKSGNLSGLAQPDTALFQEGVALLGTSYSQARETFHRVVMFYPKSNWYPYAEAYLKLLDDLNLASERAAAARQEAIRAQKDAGEAKVSFEQSQKAYRFLQEKLQAETARLQQEKDQLKNDMQRLKQLEIDLQKRERSLR